VVEEGGMKGTYAERKCLRKRSRASEGWRISSLVTKNLDLSCTRVEEALVVGIVGGDWRGVDTIGEW
jgi:hypothetical protein